MSERPFIGISGSRNDEKKQFIIRENYATSVLAAGGLPVLLPQVSDAETIVQMLDHLDGLLIAGGVDIVPSRYGEQTQPFCGEMDARRDEFELTLIPMAIERKMPMFGICRGIQALAVAMGGTLYQDIEAQQGIARGRHEQQPPYSDAVHAVRYRQGGLLERITGTQVVQANSMHHQAVRDAGPNLRVEGVTGDGIIEAVSAVDNAWVYGVQFHPEFLADHDPHAARLFEYLVECAREYRDQLK